MQRSEAAALISRIVAFDRREADGLTVDAWFDIIGHLDYAPAYQAVLSHYRAPGAYPIRPGDIIERVGYQRRDQHSRAQDALRQSHRREILDWLGDDLGDGWGRDAPLGYLQHRMFEIKGEPEIVEAARDVVRRQTQESKALEAKHSDDLARLQLEPSAPKIPISEEWRYR